MGDESGTMSADIRGAVREATTEFDQLVDSRLRVGEEQYGDLTFLSAPTLQMALEEVADLVNYARFTGTKLILLQRAVAQLQQQAQPEEPDGFVPTSKLFGG